MDWLNNVTVHDCDDLVLLLDHCLAATQQGVSHMTKAKVKLSVRSCQDNFWDGLPNDLDHYSDNQSDSEELSNIVDCYHSIQTEEILDNLDGYHEDDCDGMAAQSFADIKSSFIRRLKDKEARSVHRVSPEGRLVKESLPPCRHKVAPPSRIIDIHSQVLRSAVAIYPGCCDKRGSVLFMVFCNHESWEHDHFTSQELARLLLYYHTLSREEIRSRGFTLVVDARGTTLLTLNSLLETIYTVEASSPGAIAIVHVLADKVAQSLLFRSPVFTPQVNIKIDLVTSIDAMHKLVERAKLPPIMGGTLDHKHDTWVDFRIECEPFLLSCREAAQFLVGVMQDMMSIDGLPRSVSETQTLIDQHEQCVRKAIEDPKLGQLQESGEPTLEKLHAMEAELCHCEDYRESMEGAEKLFYQVQDTMFKLVKLADQRLHKLEQCLQLRQFEEQSAKVIQWLVQDGSEMLSRHQTVSDNLKGIRTQQKDFDKLYFAAMTQVDKGNDMLEEASMLSQSEQFDEVTGIKEIARELKARMRNFSSQLDAIKDRIENTAKCYHLLDKSYEWALAAMKFVAGLRTDKSNTPEELDKAMTSLDGYLRDHPPLSDDAYEVMLDLSSKLDNDKLHDQCRMAYKRCQETSQLLKVRQSTLKRAKEQMELEQRRRRSSLTNNSMYYGVDAEPVWQPQASAPYSSMANFMLRRRSYAGKPSAPMYSPAAGAFRENVRDMDLAEYEEHLFSEGLITEDMSDRIVTSLPKGLSDCTVRGSRESLRGSRESLRASTENLATSSKEKSSSLPRDLSGSLPSNYGSLMQTTLNKHNKPHRKMMRKAHSIATGPDSADMESTEFNRRGAKTISMVTGSSESLPSLAEEEEEEVSGAAEGVEGEEETTTQKKYVWTPVPVNTHLMSRASRNLPSYHSMADLRMTDEEMKRRRTLAMTMSEMIQTERDYVRSLQFVIENYIPELLREDVPQALRGKRNVIFGNIEQIYQFHSQYFLAELEECENMPFQICHSFLQHAPDFYLYALYNKNKPKSDELMMEYGSRFFKMKQMELGDRMDLSSYLLKPVQRMGKYSLLLKQIIKECPEQEPEYADLRNAYEMVKFQLRHGNDLLAMDSLRDCDVNLQEQGQLLRQEEFLVWQGRKKSLRRVFLFEDLIVFSKTKRSSSGHDVYVYKTGIKTSEMGLTENIGDCGYKFEIWFRKRTARDTYILQAPNMEVKNAWVREMSRLLWKQAIKNREMRMTEMVRMGVGSKPCLDLKQSKDNINDRFVNISLNNKAMTSTPRSRSSIAVSSFEHVKNGNKRPHSIISLSSTSSSTDSSQSSGYGLYSPSSQLGGTTLESLYETSKEFPRSYTICSNESGIVADIGSTSPSLEDACTQTTLRRPVKRSDSGISADNVTMATEGSSNQPSSHMLSTDV